MGSNCCRQSDVSRVNMQRIVPENVNESVNSLTGDITLERISDHSQVYHPRTWILGNLIGKGEYGKVYQAMDKETGDLLAVKSIKLSSNPETAEKMFRTIYFEIESLKALRHNNIVKYYQTDIDLDTKQINIVLEYVTGGSLLDLLRKYGSFSEGVVKNFTTQILVALSYMHSRNVAHRDLKSANILITDNATVKLSDFGCSKKIITEKLPESVRGSPYWMAPEVVLKRGHGCPADIWSLGCVMIEMITGKPPWSEFSNKSSDVLKIIAIDGLIPKIPEASFEVRDFIKKCLIRDPEERQRAIELLSHTRVTSSCINRTQSFIKKSTNSWFEVKV